MSRGLVDSVRTLAAACPDNKRSIPLNKDDENRVNAIEKELIKLGSQVCVCWGRGGCKRIIVRE